MLPFKDVIGRQRLTLSNFMGSRQFPSAVCSVITDAIDLEIARHLAHEEEHCKAFPTGTNGNSKQGEVQRRRSLAAAEVFQALACIDSKRASGDLNQFRRKCFLLGGQAMYCTFGASGVGKPGAAAQEAFLHDPLVSDMIHSYVSEEEIAAARILGC
jgi:hypothetical protein